MTSPPSTFTSEGGRLYLAEALFAAYAYRIRCPACVGNPHRPGFIKDSAGKSTKDGLNRRQWRCQRTNSSKSIGKDCPRVTCGQYIDIAVKSLSSVEWEDVITTVLAQPTRTVTERVFIQSFRHPSFKGPPGSLKGKIEEGEEDLGSFKRKREGGEEDKGEIARKVPRHDPSTPTALPSTPAVVPASPSKSTVASAPSSASATAGDDLSIDSSRARPGGAALEVVDLINERLSIVLACPDTIDDIAQVPIHVGQYVKAIEAIALQLHRSLLESLGSGTSQVTSPERSASAPSPVTIPETPQPSQGSLWTPPSSSISETGLAETLVRDFLYSSTPSSRTAVRRRAKQLGLEKEFQALLTPRQPKAGLAGTVRKTAKREEAKSTAQEEKNGEEGFEVERIRGD